MKKRNNNAKKKFTILLSEREVRVLTRYAKCNRCTRPDALRRMVKSSLRSFVQNAPEEQPANQLNLFNVSIQTNLLDQISDENVN